MAARVRGRRVLRAALSSPSALAGCCAYPNPSTLPTAAHGPRITCSSSSKVLLDDLCGFRGKISYPPMKLTCCCCCCCCCLFHSVPMHISNNSGAVLLWLGTLGTQWASSGRLSSCTGDSPFSRRRQNKPPLPLALPQPLPKGLHCGRHHNDSFSVSALPTT